MCGIAGVVDLRGKQAVDRPTVERMARSIIHRGPDEDGFLFEPGIGWANRRLSIVGLHDGKQPISNEDGSVSVVFNGELFDYPEKKAMLEAKGHVFKTHCDTELFVHLYEEFGDQLVDHLRGQFAFAIFDRKKRHIVMGRDRIGICPFFWSKTGDHFIFGSEIKAILASKMVPIKPDLFGLSHMFAFFAMGADRTPFENIKCLEPGHMVTIDFRSDDAPAEVKIRQYWDLDFPDQGKEDNRPADQILRDFEAVLRRSVEIRLRADVPVVSYLSGGVDSTTVAILSSQMLKRPIPTFTIKIPTPKLDETDRALMAAKVIGADPFIVTCDSRTIAEAYPKLVMATDAPVMDTSCAALYCLAEEVRRRGFKVAVTGEGADEALAGYPWFKTNRLLHLLDNPLFQPSRLIRRIYRKLKIPQVSWERLERNVQHVGGHHAIMDLYGLVGQSRFMFFSDHMFEQLGDHVPYDDLRMPTEKMKRWHPLNRSLYMGYKVMLPGLLLNHKGDRPAMGNSVETRYPFLDEEFIQFCAQVHPDWKLRGIRRDKHLLRTFAKSILPPEIADRPKAMFRAPFANSFFDQPPPYVDQLLSVDSLRKTGYFDPEKVEIARRTYHQGAWLNGKRLPQEMGLTGVMATQLWHHLYVGGGLCDLPTWQAP